MPRREDHEVHKDMWWNWEKKKFDDPCGDQTRHYFDFKYCPLPPTRWHSAWVISVGIVSDIMIKGADTITFTDKTWGNILTRKTSGLPEVFEISLKRPIISLCHLPKRKWRLIFYIFRAIGNTQKNVTQLTALVLTCIEVIPIGFGW